MTVEGILGNWATPKKCCILPFIYTKLRNCEIIVIIPLRVTSENAKWFPYNNKHKKIILKEISPANILYQYTSC
jgi:hypothetical protein